MLRDSRCDREYFDVSIKRYIEDTKYYEESVAEDIANEKKSTITLKGWIYSGHLSIAISYYSAGYPIVEVKEKFLQGLGNLDLLAQYVSNIQDNKLSLDQYNIVLWTVSLAVLLDIEESNFRLIAESIDKMNRPDRLIDLLLSYKLRKREIHEDSFYSGDMAERYRPLFEIFENNDIKQQISTLKEYLKLWYRRQQSCAWYGNHKRHNYIGYWSFESAAIAKICKISDKIMLKNKYFPEGFEANT